MGEKWFATSHGSFLVIKPIPWILWMILTPPLSIKACPFAFDKLVPEFQRLRIVKFMLQEAFFIPIRLNLKWGDSCPSNQGERGLFPIPNKLCKACVADHPAKGGFDIITWLYSSLFINNNRWLSLWLHSYCLYHDVWFISFLTDI